MMKRLILAAALSCSLAGCAGLTALTTGATTPATIAGHTSADEEAMRSAELLYKTWRTVVETAVDGGFIKGERATKVADLDNRFYAGLKAVRAAYRSFNATDFRSAIQNVNDVAAEAQAAVKGN